MTHLEFAVLARELVEPGIAFRARPGPRTLKRSPHCTVIGVDLEHHGADDMRAGFEKARQIAQDRS